MFFKSVFWQGNYIVKQLEAVSDMDWFINQTDVKSLNGRSGVVSKRICTNAIHVWTQTMYSCAEVTDVVSSILLAAKSHKQHWTLSSNFKQSQFASSNKKALSPFYYKKIFFIENECKHPMGVLHSFFTKNIIYDKMDLMPFLFWWGELQINSLPNVTL